MKRAGIALCFLVSPALGASQFPAIDNLKNQYIECTRRAYLAEAAGPQFNADRNANTAAERALYACQSEENALFSMLDMAFSNRGLALTASTQFRLRLKNDLVRWFTDLNATQNTRPASKPPSPLFLSCSGTQLSSLQIEEKVDPIAMAVDTERATVSFGGHEPWPIVKDNRQNTISFAGSFVDETGLVGGTKGERLYMAGEIDRVTGKAIMHLHNTHIDGPQIALFLLICKPSKRLF